MIPWKFCCNNILLRRTRTLLTILSIAGGVAAVVAVLQATAATRSQLDSLHQKLASRVALEIVAADGGAFSEIEDENADDLPPLAQLPGVRAAVSTFRAFTKIVANGEEVRGIALGVDPNQYRFVRDFKITSGRIYADPSEVCVAASVADRMGLKVGDDIRLQSRGLPWPVSRSVVGILEPQGVAALEETASIFLPLTAAARLGRAAGKVTAVQIVLEPKVEPATVATAIKARLPRTLMLTKPASAADMSQPTEALINVSLNVAAALSVVAAIFIVVNTFQISVAERQRQLALLRIVGATTEQIRATMYREALLLGAAGTIVGILLGIAGSTLLAQGVDDVFGYKMPFVAMRLHAILGGVVFGPLVTLVSVWYPARTACDAAPLSILRSATAPRRGIPLRIAVGMGFTALLVSLLMFASASLGILSMWTSIVGIALVLVAGVLFLPTLIRPGSFLLYGPIRRLFPVEAQLGRRQILDNFGRSSLTIAVLFVVTATSTSIGNTTLSVTRDVQLWLDRTITSDFLLRASRPRVDMSETEPVPDDFEARLAAIPGIAAIDRVTFSLITVNGTSATLLVREFPGYESLPMDLREGDPPRVRENLLAGEAVLGTVLAHKLGSKPGDAVRIEASGVSHSVKVTGIAQEYTAGGLMVTMDREAAQRLFLIQQTHVYMIRSDQAATADVGAALRSACRERGLIFQSLSDCRQLVSDMVASVTNRLWLILTLALVIAGFAIVNTLTMNVIEQTRCLGVLRVVGMSRLQVFRMFLFQAFVLGLLALVPGTIMGVVMAFLISISFRGVADHEVAFGINQTLLGGYLIIGLLLSLLAAALPAIRAGRLKPLEAIHEE